MKTFITILGCHRSGTSMNTGILGQLGVDLGNNLMQANQFNAKGYFENNDIVAANDRFLHGIGAKWDSFDPIDESVFESKGAIDAIDDYGRVYSMQYNAMSKSYGFKDPRTSRLIPLWRKFAQKEGVREKFIIAVRNPESCAQSLQSRDGFAKEKVYLHWWRTYADITKYINPMSDACLFLDYDTSLANPTETIDRIIRFTESTPSEREYDAALTFIARDLNHSKNDFVPPPAFNDAFNALKDGDFSALNSAQLLHLTTEYSTKINAEQSLTIATISAEIAASDARIYGLAEEVRARGIRINTLTAEVMRLRNMIYNSPVDKHLYRAWRVLLNDAHYTGNPSQ
jgi:hypothetical protein